jgi:hypothetical protein
MSTESTTLATSVASVEVDERRVKIISIRQEFLIDVLNWWRNPPHWLALPVTDELPPDCVVIAVNVSFERRCIEALIASNEFPICEPGCIPERIPGAVTEFRHVEFQTSVLAE